MANKACLEAASLCILSRPGNEECVDDQVAQRNPLLRISSSISDDALFREYPWEHDLTG
jgi:hypothetical protein